jgi:2-aminoadipate transaminase
LWIIKLFKGDDFMQTPWEHRFAQRTQNMGGSAIRELLKLTQDPSLISFAGGLPAPEVFPVDEFRDACDVVLSEVGSQALQYSTTEGCMPLREMIARHSSRYGIEVEVENIQITSGSQQALDLLGKILINPGDRILVEAPTYLGALQAWNTYGPEYVTVPSDEFGMKTDALENALRSGPKFIYVLPNFQNPMGVTLPLERRQQLIELADRYGVPIVEDDPYGQLRYEGEHIPPVLVLDIQYQAKCNNPHPGNVIYLSTFSKTLAPGIRLAWIVAPKSVISKIVMTKQGADLHTSTFNQLVAHQVAHSGFLDQHIRLIRKMYGERRDVMLAAMEKYFPKGVKWTKPEGGMFLWVTLPEGLDAKELFKKAVKLKVAYVPGESFYPNGGGENTLRMNFSNATPEQINTGIERLGEVFTQALEQM